MASASGKCGWPLATIMEVSMSQDDLKTRITGHIWQSIAQSQVPVSSIPKDQLDTLVGAIADGVLAALGDLHPAYNKPGTAGADEEEQLLWRGRPLLSLVEEYTVTSQRVRIRKGLLSRRRDDIELIRIQDLDISQGLGGRIINRGTILIASMDATDPHVRLRSVASPDKVHEILRRAMLSARQRYRVVMQQEMVSGGDR
jgi:hypothetical protein